MKLLDVRKEVQKLNSKLDEVPWEVYCAFGASIRDNFGVAGSEVCLGEDYLSVGQARDAVNWVAEQLGGAVKWSK